jgi:hypothetical protein
MKKAVLQASALFVIGLIAALPASFALEITNVQVSSVTADSAVVTWNTDVLARGIVHYGKDTNLGFEESHSHYSKDHILYLTTLDDGTKYYFTVESIDPNNVVKVDDNSGNFYTFTTTDITPPAKVSGLAAEEVGKDYVKLKWDENQEDDLSHYIIYKDYVEIGTSAQPAFIDNNLQSDTGYNYRVSAVDTSNNEGELSDTLAVRTLSEDTTPPAISGVKVEQVSGTTATISWATDEDATSVVYYGIGNLEQKKEDAVLQSSHLVVLEGLQEGATYSYVAGSCDANNNCANSTLGEFDVPSATSGSQYNQTGNASVTLEVSLPEFHNKKNIDITGTVAPYSQVKLYVNDMQSAARVLDPEETADGTFAFYNVALSSSNVIKIVAKSQSGAIYSKTYHIDVDTEKPVVELNEIPDVAREKSITISGKVNEFVTMKVYVMGGQDTEPAQITGLKATATESAVELEWDKNEEDDFSHYVIYRDDVGAIAITKPSSYNTYEDVLVNGGETYTYMVSAVNKFGNEGPKSDAVSVLVPGANSGIPKPEEITDITGGVTAEEAVSVNVSGAFSKTIELGEDGTYMLKMEFIDKASNKVTIEKEIAVDTTPPEIKVTSPAEGAFIYENYADSVDITGETEPNAEVHLFIERTPFGFMDDTFDISGFPDEIKDLPESKLRADCKLAIKGTHFCSTGADYSTTADSNGNFRFENVDLTTLLGAAARVSEVPATEFSKERELKESTQTRLLFIATDKSGLRNALLVKYSIGTCWSGDFNWDITPVAQYQSPSMLSMERLRENTEQLFFYFDYKYVGGGSGENAKITDVSVSRACRGSDLLKDPRFNLSCKILPPAGITKVNEEGTKSYTIVKLERMEEMDKWLGDDWEDFFKAVGNEMTFPFKVRITYEHTVNGETVKETQTTCQEVTYILDNTLIDPRKALPDWLLYDFVDFLNDSISAINKVQEELAKVIDYVAIGCVATFLLRLGWQVYRRFISTLQEKKFLLAKYSKLGDWEFEVQSEEDKEYCKGVVEGIKKQYGLSLGSIKLRYFSDADLDKCFPSVYSAWKTEAKLYNYYRLSCDRLFGHSTPSRWTEQASDSKLTNKLKTGSMCANDESARGKPLWAVKCRDVETQFDYREGHFGIDDKCLIVQRGRDKELYTIGNLVDAENNIYEINIVPNRRRASFEYAIKQSENTYLTAQDDYCAAVCGITEASATRNNLPEKAQGTRLKQRKLTTSTKDNALWECMPARECMNMQLNKPTVTRGEEKIKVQSSYTAGFTRDCFYGTRIGGMPHALELPDSVSNNPEKRYECCCINAVQQKDEGYYRYDDENKYAVNGEHYHAFESKTKKGQPPQGGTEGERWADMKWSYRYWKEGYQTMPANKKEETHYKYNKYRYMKGRDFPACFGQNSWLYDLGAQPGEGNLVVIDPSKQFVSTFQCLHIAGIYSRLQLIKNVMAALSSCLISVRTTGIGDSGACKEFFTMYVCSTLWDIIQFFRNGCTPFGIIDDLTASENSVLKYFTAGAKSIWDSVADTQQEVAEEYGNAKLNNLIGAGEEAVARKICLGMFGYDWEMNLNAVVDAAYASPQSTLVQKITGSREFLTLDPDSENPRYEYRASWLINPGCDMTNYKVELSCVSRNEIAKYGGLPNEFGAGGINCEKVDDPGGNNCDCLGLDSEKVHSFYSHPSKLTQGVLENRQWSQIIESPYRYDHLKFTIRPDSRISPELRERCFPEMHEDGVFYFPLRDKTAQDIAMCHVDVSQGKFVCAPDTGFWTTKGRAFFEGVKINGKEAKKGDEIEIYRGGKLEIEPIIRKLSGNPVCLVIELYKQPNAPERKYDTINADGTHNYYYKIEDNVQPVVKGVQRAELEKCEFKEGGGDGNCADKFKSKYLKYRVLKLPAETSHLLGEVTFTDEWDENTKNSIPDGKITISTESGDRMKFGTEQQISQWIADDGEGKLTIEKDGAKIQILSVGFNSKMKSATYKVKIESPDEGEQEWKLNLLLRESRDGDCSRPGSVISYQGTSQSLPYKLKIMKEGAAIVGVNIRGISSPITLDSPLEVTFTIRHEANYPIEKITYSISALRKGSTSQIGNDKPVEIGEQCTKKGSNEMTCTIEIKKDDLKQSGSNDYAGTYYLKIKAEDEKGNTGSDTERFEVYCEGGNEYGNCVPEKERCEIGDIDSPEVACMDGYKCCKT